MESIASILRTRRESLNLSLEQISNDTRISLHHLKSLESGSYADLPGGMYDRAILRSYCDELGLDRNEILQCFDNEVAPQQEKPVISHSAPFASKIKTHTAVAWSLIVLLCVGLFLNRERIVSTLSPYFSSGYGRHQVGVLPGRQPVQANAASADTTENTAADGQTVKVPAQTIQTTPGVADESFLQPLRVEIAGTEECWLSVNRDDSGAVTKILSPGDVEFFTATRTISLIVGNAGGVSLRINDRAAKTLGSSGQVVHLTIDKDTLQNLIDISAS